MDGVVGMDIGVMDGVIAAAVVGDVVVVEDAVAATVVVARGGPGILNDFLFFSFRPLRVNVCVERYPRGDMAVDELLLLGKRWRLGSSMAWRIWHCILEWNLASHSRLHITSGAVLALLLWPWPLTLRVDIVT